MKKSILTITLLIALLSAAISQGYKVGDKATDFRLLNIDGSYVSMADYPDAKGFVVIFSCNHCPYVVVYEDRIIDLHNKYAPKRFPVIAINPNDSLVEPRDSYSKMIERANQKGFPFPYLIDANQKISPQYGATHTPHVFLLERRNEALYVAYIGTIDDNFRDASRVKVPFLANAIDALLEGRKPDPDFTRAIGCTIKTKK